MDLLSEVLDRKLDDVEAWSSSGELPAGTYVMQLGEPDLGAAKSGTPQVRFPATVVEGDYKGARRDLYYSLASRDGDAESTAKVLGKLKGEAEALGIVTRGLSVRQVLQRMAHRRALVRVSYEDRDGRQYARLRIVGLPAAETKAPVAEQLDLFEDVPF